MNGKIIINRKILQWEWWSEPATAHLFVTMLMLANWKDTRWRGIELPRGSFATSYASLASVSGLSIQQVRTAIRKLVETQEIKKEVTNKFTIITIVKYSVYQNFDLDSNTQDNKQTTSKQQSSNNQPTNKQQSSNNQSTTAEEYKEREEGEERKEREESKKRIIRHRYGEFAHVTLSDDEYQKLCDQYGDVDTHEAVKYLDDYIERKGYKHKNSYLTLKKWVFDAVREERQRKGSESPMEQLRRLHDDLSRNG